MNHHSGGAQAAVRPAIAAATGQNASGFLLARGRWSRPPPLAVAAAAGSWIADA
jgi:hypothetical protein